jgi:hypothetical protein
MAGVAIRVRQETTCMALIACNRRMDPGKRSNRTAVAGPFWCRTETRIGGRMTLIAGLREVRMPRIHRGQGV